MYTYEHRCGTAVSVTLYITPRERLSVSLLNSHPRDGHSSLRHVHPGSVLSEGVVLHQQPHQVAPWQKLHHHVQVHVVLTKPHRQVPTTTTAAARARKTNKTRKTKINKPQIKTVER